MTMLIEALREQLQAVTDRCIEAQHDSVHTAVRLIAAKVREVFPDAKRVELESSDQGPWLFPSSIDGDGAKIEVEALADDLNWAASCIYEGFHGSTPALQWNEELSQYGEHFYIDIEEALK